MLESSFFFVKSICYYLLNKEINETIKNANFCHFHCQHDKRNFGVKNVSKGQISSLKG